MEWKDYSLNYLNYLRIERGLSQNSVDSYALDLNKLISHIEEHDLIIVPKEISADDLKGFLYKTSKILSSRSQARLISSLKSFFNYLYFDGIRHDNPMELIETPRIGRKLPDTLP